MTFIKTPVKGMPEQMPDDMELREFVLSKIKSTYKRYGFMQISTPLIEHIENLTNKQGGENEQLIFKILKRGEKLLNANGVDDLCDSGLRYDLTVPLSRFYSNNSDKLPMPFKSLQIGESFRADKPQKGRFRQFTQCDIDILGDTTNLAEIELILATVNMLNQLGINNVKVKVNDRNILKAMALYCDFPENDLDTIFIILDKMDKIGLQGVKEELIKMGLQIENIEKYCSMFEDLENNEDYANYFSNKLNGFLSCKTIDNLKEIIECVKNNKNFNDKIVFDPTLVRGMSYYTGPIFEIELENFNSSVAGGGRYDKMIGQFCGKDVSAVGFSIGFERIISVIKDNQLISVPSQEKIAVLVDKNINNEMLQYVMNKVSIMREEGKIILVAPRNNNVKFQKENLSNFGYKQFYDVFNDKCEL